MLVRRFQTPIPLDSLVDALDAGHHELDGQSLTPDSYAIAASQLELEHGTGLVNGVLCLRAVEGFNEGNIDASSSARSSSSSIPVFTTVPEREVGAGGVVYHQTHVREAYPDAVEGARGYWQALLDDFSDAYDAISAGKLAGFVHALKMERYFTDSESVYLRGMQPMFTRWQARIAAAGAV